MISAGIQIAMSGARRRPFALWAQRVVALLSASGLRGWPGCLFAAPWRSCGDSF